MTDAANDVYYDAPVPRMVFGGAAGRDPLDLGLLGFDEGHDLYGRRSPEDRGVREVICRKLQVSVHRILVPFLTHCSLAKPFLRLRKEPVGINST